MMKKESQPTMKQVCDSVLKRITPTKLKRETIEGLARELERKVSASAVKKGIEAIVRVEGSVAKDTWLKEEPDIDVFMCLPPTTPKKVLGTVSLEIAREATEGSRQVERFAEHPYLEAFVEGVRVNIVPCYCVESGEWLSATDRTPFHTDYVKKHLSLSLRSEVRLLKSFLQGIGVYGAEIKVGGFSGYLCELLIINYGSFLKTLQVFAECTPRMEIDIEDYYSGRGKELQLLFDEPLVVIDPADKGRNVASAVRPQRIHLLAAAARQFLRTPNEQFFFPSKTKALSCQRVRRQLEKHGSDFLFLTFSAVNAVPDVLWGQLYRTQRALRKLLELHDFQVLREMTWSDEETLNIFVFELEQQTLPCTKKHLGPPLEREQECDNFLAKYAGNKCVVSGPYIEDGRWKVELTRKQTDAVKLLSEKLAAGSRNVGVAELISEAFKVGFSILANEEVTNVYSSNSKFAEFFTDFLSGKPFWLKAS